MIPQACSPGKKRQEQETGPENNIRSLHDEYRRLGYAAPESRAAYRELFRYQLDAALIDELREATNHERAAGASRFKGEIEAMKKRRVQPGKPGRPKKETEVARCRELSSALCFWSGIFVVQ